MESEESAASLPVSRVGDLVLEEERSAWLVEELWGASSVGVLGGAPKCCKSWLGLDLAVSVASATACLGRFPVAQSGPALVYLAEDALPVVRQRVEGIARHRGLALRDLDLHVITATSLRLDRERDRARLRETARRLRPRLLLLDPLVRLHTVDENSAGEVARLLSYIRELERTLALAVVLVHHSRKNASPSAGEGQALRGSGDLHAFGDSNLYLRRSRDRLLLSTEHRAAPSSQTVVLELVASDPRAVHLEVVATAKEEAGRRGEDLERRVLRELTGERELTRSELRAALGVKNERLGEVLELLERSGALQRVARGWRRSARESAVPRSPSIEKGTGTIADRADTG